jgi:hypothetical protein
MIKRRKENHTMVEKLLEGLTVMHHANRCAPQRPIKTSVGVARMAVAISVMAIATLLSACSTSTPTGTSAPQQVVASNTPAPIATPSSTGTPNPTDTPMVTSTAPVTSTVTVLDPCQLLPSQEASSLAGTSFGAGAEGTIPGGGKTCTYGSQSTNIFFVEVVQAPDKATADAAQTQFINDLNANLKQLTNEGFTVTPVTNFADAAITAQVNINAAGQTVNGSAFAFRKGTIFFGFSDVVLGAAAPSNDALQSEATTVLSRLP